MTEETRERLVKHFRAEAENAALWDGEHDFEDIDCRCRCKACGEKASQGLCSLCLNCVADALSHEPRKVTT